MEKTIIQLIVSLNGVFDGEAVEQFDLYCTELLKNKFSFDELVVDLIGINFIRSVGIGKLVFLSARLMKEGKTMSLINSSNPIYEQFCNLRLDRIFIIKKVGEK